MNCPICGTGNSDAAKFCKKCGKLIPKPEPMLAALGAAGFCPQCGKPKKAGALFCAHCGTTLNQGSIAEKPPAVLPGKPRRKGSGWIIAGAVLAVLLTCGFLFWSMLIPIPVLASNGSEVDVLEQVRIIQENLGRPPFIENIAQQAELNRGAQGVQIVDVDENGNPVLPAACGPQAELTVVRQGEVHISDMWGRFTGRGPLVYTLQNRGESMAGAEFGYHAVWTVVDEGKSEVIANNHWYSCAGWEQDRLTCTGPNWQNYDSAQMCIYYDDPDCPIPLQCFAFQGEDLLPVEDAQACNIEADFVYAGMIDYGDPLVYLEFTTTDQNLYDNKYMLYTHTHEGVSTWSSWSVCWAKEGKINCEGYSPNEFESVLWEILLQPRELCTQPVAAGVIQNGKGVAGGGEGEVNVEVDCGTEVEFELQDRMPYGDAYLEDLGPRYIQYAWYLIGTTDVNDQDGDYVLWSSGTGGQSGEGAPILRTCENYDFPVGENNLLCTGYNIHEFDSVEYELFKNPMEICTEPVWWAESIRGQNPDTDGIDRCDLFDDIDMSMTIVSWEPDSPFVFYVNMPGGIPGLEKSIPGDDGYSWNYWTTIGDYDTNNCDKNASISGRVYCRIAIPSDYARTFQPVNFYVSFCETPIYSRQAISMPEITTASGDNSTVVEPPSSGSPGGPGPITPSPVTPVVCVPACPSLPPYTTECCCETKGHDWYNNKCNPPEPPSSP